MPLPHHFSDRISEHRFGASVPEANCTISISEYDGFGRLIDNHLIQVQIDALRSKNFKEQLWLSIMRCRAN